MRVVSQGGQDVSHPLLGEAGPLRGGAGVQGQPGLGEGKPWTCRSIVRGWSQSESATNAAGARLSKLALYLYCLL